MTATYYIEIAGGVDGTDIASIRRMAIDYLWLHPSEKAVTVYTSHTRKQKVGTVTYTASNPLFLWTKINGGPRTLYRDGNIYHKP